MNLARLCRIALLLAKLDWFHVAPQSSCSLEGLSFHEFHEIDPVPAWFNAGQDTAKYESDAAVPFVGLRSPVYLGAGLLS